MRAPYTYLPLKVCAALEQVVAVETVAVLTAVEHEAGETEVVAVDVRVADDGRRPARARHTPGPTRRPLAVRLARDRAIALETVPGLAAEGDGVAELKGAAVDDAVGDDCGRPARDAITLRELGAPPLPVVAPDGRRARHEVALVALDGHCRPDREVVPEHLTVREARRLRALLEPAERVRPRPRPVGPAHAVRVPE